MKNKKPPTGIFARSAKLLKAGAQIAGQELAYQAKAQLQKKMDESSKLKARIEQATALTKALGELKGSAMKFGQLLSLEGQDWLPPEVIDILSKLQKDAPPVDPKLLFALAESDIGKVKLQDLHLDPSPLAKASIGQVFIGELSGQKIVTKIQYPDIWKTVDSDIQVLQSLSNSFAFLLGKQMDFDEVFDEIKFVISREADYRRELENLQRFKTVFSSRPDYVIPSNHPEYSGLRTLTMSYEPGFTIKEWIDRKPARADKIFISKLILDLFFIEFFDLGMVQTDPNLANFLVQENPLKLVLLDFGAVVDYEKEFVKTYRELLEVSLSGTREEAISFIIKQGYLDPRENEDVKEKFYLMIRKSMEPFQKVNQPFDFADKDYSDELRRMVLTAIRAMKFSVPPKGLIFLHRKLGGIFHLLKMMDLQIDLSSYWDQVIANGVSTKDSL